ncbi:unnamed protein product [Brachionus calyciflorus]|uniref:TLC domain-containing protein n=1 Tax=Brachionus calyciflorus TaxID=104777 RepID=A0A814AVP7_9BILA|nr:unnamed protein product [Brachionus calyciflorus]
MTSIIENYKKDFGYTTNPGYIDLVVGSWKAILWHYRTGDDNWGNYSFPRTFFDELNQFYHFPYDEIQTVVYLVIGFTLVRYLFEMFVCKPLVNYLKIDKKSERKKFPESFWKTIVYTIFWFYSFYLLTFKYDYFNQPEHLFDGWLNETQVPFDIKIIYLAEGSFYIHSIYATIFMDVWRKDFVIMLIHHFVTVTLIVGSYGMRFHRFGLLVLFCHDVNDLLLEFTKCNVYMKNRNGKFYGLHETISFIGFATFTVTWYMFRLYWFPLKILYASSVITCHRAYQLAYKNGAKFYALFNGLLFTLFLLNVYWFYLILRMLVRVLKDTNDTDDIRDYDSDAEIEKEKKKN